MLIADLITFCVAVVEVRSIVDSISRSSILQLLSGRPRPFQVWIRGARIHSSQLIYPLLCGQSMYSTQIANRSTVRDTISRVSRLWKPEKHRILSGFASRDEDQDIRVRYHLSTMERKIRHRGMDRGSGDSQDCSI